MFKKKTTSEQQRDNIISKGLDTPEGRNALAQAMIAPIATSLNYQYIGRKLLSSIDEPIIPVGDGHAHIEPAKNIF